MINKIAVLEGLLFIAGDEGLSENELCTTLNEKINDVNLLLKELKDKLASDDTRGLQLVKFDGQYKLATKPEHIEFYSNLVETTVKKNKLSQAALETLAIIAYKGPITRTEVEDVRGVGADTMLSKLEAMALIKEVGRTDGPGRPILYNVTPEFYDHFGISSKDELPELPELKLEDDEQDLFETNRVDKKINVDEDEYDNPEDDIADESTEEEFED